MVRRFGPDVVAWCDHVPRLAAQLARRWGLTDLEPVARGGTSRVIACRQDGLLAYLKLTPEHQLATDEALALRAWERGGRAPRVLASDTAAGALLLEGIEPGTPLTQMPEAPTADEIAALMRALHVPPPTGLAPLRERVDFVFAITRRRAPGDRVAGDAIERSHALALRLADDHAGPASLVHGDLHPGNVLTGPRGRELVAIDPRACAGDPAFDLVDWIVDRAGPDAWAARASALAEATGLPSARVWDWMRALAVVVAGTRDDLADRLVALAP